MHFVLSLIVTVLGLWTWTGHAQVASVSLRPLEFIASEGSSTCSVTNADALLWRVDFDEILMRFIDLLYSFPGPCADLVTKKTPMGKSVFQVSSFKSAAID